MRRSFTGIVCFFLAGLSGQPVPESACDRLTAAIALLALFAENTRTVSFCCYHRPSVADHLGHISVDILEPSLTSHHDVLGSQASGMAAAGSSRATAAQIIRSTLQEKGVRGLYCGYWATLSRNIPSAVIRFSLYEEIKL